MKKIGLLFTLCMGMILISCSNDNKAAQAQANGEEPSEAVASEPIQDPNDSQARSGSAAPALVPGESEPVQHLTKDFWVIEYYVVPGDRVESKRNRGRWWDFKNDGTFVSGQWQETTGSGSWRLGWNPDMKRHVLTMDNVVDSEDSEFEIIFNGDGDASAWVGTKSFGQGGIQAKAIQLLALPTKAQFGLE